MSLVLNRRAQICKSVLHNLAVSWDFFSPKKSHKSRPLVEGLYISEIVLEGKILHFINIFNQINTLCYKKNYPRIILSSDNSPI